VSFSGHRMTGGAIAASGLILLPFKPAVMFAIGCLLGSAAPDWLEIVWFYGRRNSLIPHRTVTHWPWLCAVIAALALFTPEPARWLFGGFLVGWAVHLVLDYATVSGIPFGNPFGKRHGLRLYKTDDGFAETVIVLVFWMVPLLSLFLR